MFAIIVGGGKVGTYLARDLLQQNHEVVVVEKDARKAQFMTNLLEQDVAIVGDGCDPIVLSQAGLSRADVVVADTGDDEDNLVVCLIAQKNSKARCIARVNNPRNKEIFDSIGTPENKVSVVSSTELILNIIEDEVNISECRPLARLRNGDLELVKISVDKASTAVGKRIADLGFPRSSIVVALERADGEVTIPNGDTRISAGDEVVLMIKSSARGQVREALLGTASTRARLGGPLSRGPRAESGRGADGGDGGLRTVACAQLLEDVADVPFDCAEAEVEALGDLGVADTVGDESENLEFAGCERVVGGRLGGRRTEVAQDDMRDFRIEVSTAVGDDAYRGDKVRCVGGLDDVGIGAGCEGGENLGIEILHREDHDVQAVDGGSRSAREFDAVEAGEADVDDCDSGAGALDRLEARFAIAGFGDDFDTAGGFERGFHAGAR